MSADQQDMINKILLAQAQAKQNQPAFMGLQAPQDPNALNPLLGQLRQQQYQDQANAPTPGQYGYLHDAGKLQFNSVGQQLGQALGQGLNPQQQPQAPQGPAFTMPPAATDSDGNTQPQTAATAVPIPNPGATPQQSVTNMVMAAKAYYSAQVNSGIDPDKAKVNTAQAMVKWGVPNADEILDKANDQLLKNSQTKAATNKDTSQANMDTASIANQADEQKGRAVNQALEANKNTWSTVSETPQTVVQKNGLGEVRVQQKMPASQAAASNVSPDAMQAMLDSYHTTGNVPPGLARSPAMAGAFWDAEAKYQAQTGNTAGSVLAAKSSAKANTDALAQTQKQISQTTSYFDTMDKNIAKAREYGNQIDFGDATTLNKALASWQKGTSDPTYAKYNVFFDSVANEYAKIKSGALGNAPVSDSARHEAQGVIAQTIGNGGMNAAFDAIKEEGQNRLTSLASQRDDLVNRLSGKAQPVIAPTSSAPAPAGGNVVDFGSLK